MRAPLYLGCPVFDPKPFTRIDPLAQAENGSWHIYNDWTAALPNEGKVFAPRLADFGQGDIFAFEVELNARNEHPERDRYIVSNPERVLEVLDFRNVAPEEARRTLVERGLLTLMPSTQHVVAALKNGVCVVVKMVRHPTSVRWIAEFEGLESLKTHAFDVRLFEGDQIDKRWVTIPGVTVGVATGALNWTRDTDFLEAVLKRLRKVVPQGSQPITRAQIEHIVRFLSRAELLPSSGDELPGLLDRLRAFTPDLVRNVALLDEIVDAISALRPIKERLEADFAARSADLEAELRRTLEERFWRELEQQMESLTAERAKLSAEVNELSAMAVRVREEARQAVVDATAEQSSLKAELSAFVERGQEQARQAVAEAEAARCAFKDELSGVLSEITSISPDAEETVRSLATRVGTRLREHGAEFSILATPGAPWTKPDFLQQVPKDWGEFVNTLGSAASRYGYDAADLMLADIAARAGELVILPEDGASRFVRCYADVICGGNIVRHVLDPSVLCVDDIWRQAGSGQPTAFGRAWAAANFDPRRFRIVLLEGLQRTPIDLWVTSLVDLMQDPRRPSNLLVFVSAGGSLLDAKRTWQGMDRSVIALAPTQPSTLSPQLLASASRREMPRACFNASVVPAPEREAILGFLEKLENRAEARALERMGAAYRAAWPLTDALDTAAWAAAFEGAEGADVEVIARLHQGARWLNEMLSKDE